MARGLSLLSLTGPYPRPGAAPLHGGRGSPSIALLACPRKYSNLFFGITPKLFRSNRLSLVTLSAETAWKRVGVRTAREAQG